MQCIRNGAAGSDGGGEERKILVKAPEGDRQKLQPEDGENHGEREEQERRRDGPEVRTFLVSDNQCIVYSPRAVGGGEPMGGGGRPRSASPPLLPPRSALTSHLPPKKTLKLALSMPAAAAALTVASGRVMSPSPLPPPPPPPPLALRRSPEPTERLARIQIVSKAHEQTNGARDNEGMEERVAAVGVGGGGQSQSQGQGQGVHVIRDGRFYQPEPSAPEQRPLETERRSEYGEERHQPPPHHMGEREREGAMGPRDEGRGPQHPGSIIVVNGSATVATLSRIPSPHDRIAEGEGMEERTVLQQHRSPHAHTTILVTHDRPSAIYKPTVATSSSSSSATVSSSNRTPPQHQPSSYSSGLQHQQQQQQPASNNTGHVTSMQPPPPPPPLKQLSKGGGGSGGHEEPSSSMPDLEFDGTTVLCRVCGDKASGFHYGVHSCEGCKGFFRRSIQQKIQYRPCTKNQQCSILRINRNRCQYCRLKKCIAVGMSRDAVRFGRVPKREKARILAAMQQSTQNRGNQRALASELDDQPRLLASVLQAHVETCEFTREKVSAMRQRARDCPNYSMPTLACPLNPAPELQSEQEFSQRFAHVIRGVIDFAGMIPGFQLLTQDDKFTLLKAGLFDALFVRLICMFDTTINSIICLNGQVMRRDTIQNGANARFLVDSTFNFAERMNSMNLTDAEIGLFCAIVLITPDRPGLRNVELIERMYTKLKACLQTVITQNRPDKPEFMQELLRTMPDLRTLSTLHTEKLVVFRTEHKGLLRQQMWSNDEDHGAVLSDAKSPASSTASWSCDGNQVEVEIAKSPMSSVSSTESTETSSSSSSGEYHHHLHHHGSISSASSASAPLLAATLSGACPIIRHRASSGSSAEDDLIGGTAQHLAQNGLTITPVIRSVGSSSSSSSAASASSSSANNHHHHHHVSRYRKLDSPTDSGIESGNEKHDHPSTPHSLLQQHQQQQLQHHHHHLHSHHHPKPASSVSSGSSSCSSPRSSLEDQALDDSTTTTSSSSKANDSSPPPATTTTTTTTTARHGSVDNMPVLKRVLQAPPLYDTNSLMDEAYKPHKKFRAMRHRESEAEAAVASSSSSTSSSSSASSSAAASSSASSSSSSAASPASSSGSAGNNQPHQRLETTVVTVLASSSSPRPTTQQQQPPQLNHHHLHQHQQTPPPPPPQHHQSQLHMHLTRPQTSSTSASASSANQSFLQHHSSSSASSVLSAALRCSPQPVQHHYSSLSSTHSVLAKSLMEEPRMTPEQMKRTDIIHNYIMRESAHEQQQNYIKQQQQQQQGGLLVCGNGGNSVFQRASPHLTVSAISPSPSSSSSGGGSPAASGGGCPYGGSMGASARWHANANGSASASVITTTGLRGQQTPPSPGSSSSSSGAGSLTPPDTSSSSSSSLSVSSPPSAASPCSTSIRYFQSPHSTMTSPAPPASPSSMGVARPLTPSPRLIELKVDIGSAPGASTTITTASLDPCQQPLNLSKKSPSPAPHIVSVLQRPTAVGPVPSPTPSSLPAATAVVVATSSSNGANATANPTIHKILLEA